MDLHLHTHECPWVMVILRAEVERDRQQKKCLHFSTFLVFVFCFVLLLRSQISTAEALKSCLQELSSQGRAQALLGRGQRGRPPARRTADHEQNTENIPKLPNAPETFQNKTKLPNFQKPRVSTEGETRPHAEKPARERAPSLADLHRPSQTHPSGPARVRGLTKFSWPRRTGGQRVWVPAHPSPKVNMQLKSRRKKGGGKKQKQICKFPVYKQHTALSGMVSRLGIRSKRKQKIMNLMSLRLCCPFAAALAHRLRAGIANGREK